MSITFAHSTEVIKCCKFLPLNLELWACADKYLATVTEGVAHGVYKVVTRSSFRVPHKAGGGNLKFRHCVKTLHTSLTWKLKDRGVLPKAGLYRL